MVADAVPSSRDHPSQNSEGDRVRIGELVDRWSVYGRDEIVEQLAAWDGDPVEVIDVVIESMTDHELRSVITSLTGLTDKDLHEVHGLRAFARRASAVAMENIVSVDDSPPQILLPVEFSHDPNKVESFKTDQFVGDERIFAVFPTGPSTQDEVFVKWYRSDDPEILLFDRYPIQRETDQDFVWLENKEGWPQGEYAVEIYSADKAMSHLASGRYVVDPALAGPFGKLLEDE